jgi:hypothetical protein
MGRTMAPLFEPASGLAREEMNADKEDVSRNRPQIHLQDIDGHRRAREQFAHLVGSKSESDIATFTTHVSDGPRGDGPST